jgi:hypothetical protein
VELYEKLVGIGMLQGHDNPTEIINHVLDVEMKLEEWCANASGPNRIMSIYNFHKCEYMSVYVMKLNSLLVSNSVTNLIS